MISLTHRKPRAPSQRIADLTAALTSQWSEYPEAKEYIHSQWGALLTGADTLSHRSQRLFYSARWLVVVGATIVPTLVVLGSQTHGTLAAVIQSASAVLSLLVAASAGALQVTQMGHRWFLNHRLRFELERAGAQLYASRGNYTDPDPKVRFGAFVDDIEQIMRDSESSYKERIPQLGQDEGG